MSCAPFSHVLSLSVSHPFLLLLPHFCRFTLFFSSPPLIFSASSLLLSCVISCFFFSPLSSFFSLSHCLAHCLIALLCLIHLSTPHPHTLSITHAHTYIYTHFRLLYMSVSSPPSFSPPTRSPQSPSLPCPSLIFITVTGAFLSLSCCLFLSLCLCVYEQSYIESVWLADTEEKRGRECMMRLEERRRAKVRERVMERQWLISKTKIERGLWHMTIHASTCITYIYTY